MVCTETTLSTESITSTISELNVKNALKGNKSLVNLSTLAQNEKETAGNSKSNFQKLICNSTESEINCSWKGTKQ